MNQAQNQQGIPVSDLFVLIGKQTFKIEILEQELARVVAENERLKEQRNE